ncbi:glycoside hydrolase family 32 protein [Acetobacteraceae bacterium KSS8]|uniref:Glycoside hydrolase family 32 protein n=1 Tax=Endosaccharibacter trunci TaxID=2812733 RepID=A0ABT1W9L0_9PROT|nr:glycoside hydrolase family 32 protein [Acetobacteraceae bacterium KSS8]
MVNRSGIALFASLGLLATVSARAESYKEPYRPAFHYTPAVNWMNDPNGLIFADGFFQMFYQYNPVGTVAENQAWGHARGRDLLHWTELPVAIPAVRNAAGQYTDLIFSGSAVQDRQNSSGLGDGRRAPLVAVYANNYLADQTLPNGQHVVAGQQGVSIASSTDGGISWSNYAGNPVIAVPPAPYADQAGAFRDPKVFWYAPGHEWVMVAALSNIHRVILYASDNLKDWRFLSTFGPANAVFGAWECPDLFPLRPQGGGAEKWVLMVGINPGAEYAGSGTQYFVGEFDGKSFTADPDSVHATTPPAGAEIFQDFSSGQSYAALGWTGTGAFAGASPAAETIPGSVTGHVIDSFLTGDSAVGTLLSPAFTIDKPFIDFQIGGGSWPRDPATAGTASDKEATVNLLVDGRVVHSTTGNGLGAMSWRSWDVSGLRGRKAWIEVIDANDGAQGFGHIFVGDILFSDTPQLEANWLDHGPDFYATVTFNDLPESARTAVGWMNNWNYGQVIPTSPWRGQMAIPRSLSLRNTDGRLALVQNPVETLPLLHGALLERSVGNMALDAEHPTRTLDRISGRQLDISADFVPGGADTFGLHVRSGANGERTEIGYSPRTRTLFVDRTRSGDASFSSGFKGRFEAPLAPDRDGHVRIRVLVDTSSVEVFGGDGAAAITAQIFPSAGSVGVDAFAENGSAVLHAIDAWAMRDIH